jgi:hypothetical protein
MAEISERMFIAEVVQRLTRRYRPPAPDQIAIAVHTAHAGFEQSQTGTFFRCWLSVAPPQLSRRTERVTSSPSSR